ncbi:MAG: response regulator [Candidatus Aureabacteria bacterium]|nr:response regulator [Candidatus Auribacterota bacterium]
MNNAAPKILLIDDSSWWLKRMRNLIQQLGCEVMTQNCMKGGIRAIDERNPDCIVTDLLMPDGDGFGILKTLSEKNKKIPVIVLTADFQQETIDLCKALGAFEVIQKEYVKDHLAGILKKVLTDLNTEKAETSHEEENKKPL